MSRVDNKESIIEVFTCWNCSLKSGDVVEISTSELFKAKCYKKFEMTPPRNDSLSTNDPIASARRDARKVDLTLWMIAPFMGASTHC